MFYRESTIELFVLDETLRVCHLNPPTRTRKSNVRH